MTHFQRKIPEIEDYAQFIGREAVERIQKKALALKGYHVCNVNSTGYGGGVAEILMSMTLLMNQLGIKSGWRTIIGRPDFFLITKNMHNALQGGKMDLTDAKKLIYEEVVYENSIRTHLDHDFVIIHDPQPLPLVEYYRKKGPWVWRCHIDLTKPHPGLWKYLKEFVEQYDTAIISHKKYAQTLDMPQFIFLPAIDPFTIKNRALPKNVIEERLHHYKIPLNRPIITQISRFDKWKDPQGVIEAFKIARKKIDATLVLLGNAATDDPEGEEVFESLLKFQDDHIRILPYGDDTVLVNALQTRSEVVVQKSIREGFGLTVTEALWKGTPVIGGKVGGIPSQIEDGVNGFLVSSVDETAKRMVDLISDEKKRKAMGKNARESVKKKFLMTRLLEQYLDLFSSFEFKVSVKKESKAHFLEKS